MCEADSPHRIVQVQTVPAIEQAHHALVPIQAALATRELLPQQQLVDAGYVSAKRILHSAEVYGIDLIGPVHNDPSWQTRLPDALDATLFTIHWGEAFATCPQGQTSMLWQVATDAQGESIMRI